MTVTYNPNDAAYYDEADLRAELTRVFDLCHGCRLCWNLCPSFPTLFDFVDAHDGDAAAMTPAEQDKVVDECYQCKLCYLKCPYVPPHEWQLDFPRLMLRATAVRRRKRRFDLNAQVMGRTDLVGKAASALAPVANRVVGTPGSFTRRVMERVGGLAAERILPPYAKQRFSTWFRKRPAGLSVGTKGSVAVFGTCLVEYQQPQVGRDLVRVFERNQIGCSLPEGQVCCGMPWLDAGQVEPFVKQGRRNVEVLAEAVRQGRDIVVAQPTCGYVLKKEYPAYLGTEEAELVASHTYDAAEYLMKVHREGGGLDTDFSGPVPATVTWHVPCHLRAQNIGYKSRDLMQLTGTKVTVVDKCSGIDGTWGYQAVNYDLARKVAQPLKEAIERAGSEAVVGDCVLANTAITQETGAVPTHPISFIARAYGIPEDDTT